MSAWRVVRAHDVSCGNQQHTFVHCSRLSAHRPGLWPASLWLSFSRVLERYQQVWLLNCL